MKKLVEKIQSSLTIRIFFVTAMLLLAACFLTSVFLVLATPFTYQSITTDKLKEKTDELIKGLATVSQEDSGVVFEKFVEETGAGVKVAAADGTVLLDIPVADTFEKEHFGMGTMILVTSDWNMSFSFAGDSKVCQLTVVSSQIGVNQTLEAMGRVLPYLLSLMLVFSIAGAFFYSRYLTRPIVRLSRLSQQMAELDFSRKSEETRQDEIGILGRNLDEMSERLCGTLKELKTANQELQTDIERERELEKQRSVFFSAASHELKTPVTILKGQLSGMLGNVDVYQDRDKYLARSLAVTGRMESLIQKMLTISRLEKSAERPKQEPVELSALIKEEISHTEDFTVQREQTVSAHLASELWVDGDKTLLRLAVSNLLINAFVYSPYGASVQVCLWQEENKIYLTIENSGAQIPESALPHLCEAFYRVEESRSRETGGSGLGLYLVKMILQRHNADFTIYNKESSVLAEAVFLHTISI